MEKLPTFVTNGLCDKTAILSQPLIGHGLRYRRVWCRIAVRNNIESLEVSFAATLCKDFFKPEKEVGVEQLNIVTVLAGDNLYNAQQFLVAP